MAYLKQWRKCRADVQALAEFSSSDESVGAADAEVQAVDESSGSVVEEGAAISEQSFNAADVEMDRSSASDGEYDSDYGYSEEVISSSDSSDAEGDSDDEECPENAPDIAGELGAWATKHACSRAGLNELLDMLRRHGHRLPKDARTLLRTPRNVPTTDKCDGKYMYFGIESGILRDLSVNEYASDSIRLKVNIDGLPLFKSTHAQLWPILCSFHTYQPFVVALFFGTKKPKPVDVYLADFTEELKRLCENGIHHARVTYHVSIEAFVCDAPARSFLKCIKGHNSYFACERCTVRGSWEGRVVFHSDHMFPRRTKLLFDEAHYEVHQVRRTPLVDAGVDCIEQFSLDYMHLVCLGVMKRMLCFLKQGPKKCRLSACHIAQISDNLVKFNGLMPSDFSRQPRALAELDRWKATEFRQFLLYTGPVVLRNVLSTEVYDHFLSLSVALSIMLCSDDDRRSAYLPYAKDLLQFFVMKCKDIYGETFTTYNVHNLLHLHEDVQFFACSLNEVAAFQFENHLQRIKKMVKKGQNPIGQIARRLAELEHTNTRHSSKVVVSSISTRRKDNCFLLYNEEFAFVRERRPDGMLVCECIRQQHMANFFDSPCDSKLINVAFVRDNHLSRWSRRKVLAKRDVCRKAVCLPYEDGLVLFPLLHGMEHL